VPRWDAARRVTSPPALARGRCWGRWDAGATTIILPGAAEQKRRACECAAASLLGASKGRGAGVRESQRLSFVQGGLG
jgi:hypothetical protein